MNKYKLVVSVSVSNFVEIEAENENEAIKIASEKYYNGDILGDLNEHDYCGEVDVAFDDSIQWNSIKRYVIHKSAEDNYSVCRILNEYESREEAKKDLVKLLTDNMTDKQLLKKYGKKRLFD